MQMITPNMDSVQEMKITTSTYDAELGRYPACGAVRDQVRHKRNSWFGLLVQPQQGHLAAIHRAEKDPPTGRARAPGQPRSTLISLAAVSAA